jgi:hypothetical protein
MEDRSHPPRGSAHHRPTGRLVLALGLAVSRVVIAHGTRVYPLNNRVKENGATRLYLGYLLVI